MANYKIFKKGNYILFIDDSNNQIEEVAGNVFITKSTTASTDYNIRLKSSPDILNLPFANILDEAGAPYASSAAWETFYTDNTGFNPATSASVTAVANDLATHEADNSAHNLDNKADLVGGKVPASQLPSYVDDVEEYANLAAFPVTGETGKIYVALDTNKTFRWSGATYIEISPSEVSSVNGKSGVVVLDKTDIGLSNVDNTSDADKPISTATQSALDAKPDVLSFTDGNIVKTDANGDFTDGGVSVTDLVQTNTNFFLHDDVSDIGGGYLQAKTTPSSTSEVTLTGLTNLDTGTHLLNVFITNTGIPGKTELFTGIITGALKATKTAGSKNVQLRFDFFTRTTGGVETVHAVSGLSDFVTVSNARVFPIASQSPATIAETDRWGIKVYAVVSGGGSNVDIALQIEGAFNAYWKSPTVTGVVADHAGTHTDGTDDIQDATASQKGLMTSAYASKLDGIAAGATANSSDATLLNRANHTGTQTNSTISDFDAGVTGSTHAGRVDNPHAVTKTQVGLSNVPNTDATQRANHTGTQDIATTTTGTLPITRGGSGQTTQQAAIDALTNVSAATNEHVLTKDTATGNATWKAAAGGTHNSLSGLQGGTAGEYFHLTQANHTRLTTWQPPSINIGEVSTLGITVFINDSDQGKYYSMPNNADSKMSTNINLKGTNGVTYDGSNMAVVVRWRPSINASAGNTVAWVLTTAIIKDGDNSATKVTAHPQQTQTITGFLQNITYSTQLATISGAGESGAHTLLFTIERNGTGASSDSFGGAVEVLSIELIKI